MEFRSNSKDRKHVSVTKCPLWRLKNALDYAKLNSKLQQQYKSDIYGLFDVPLYADLKLETEDGVSVFSHQAVIASRSPSLWSLLFQVGHTDASSDPQKNFQSIFLPGLEGRILTSFLKSLYCQNIDRASESQLLDYLKNFLLFSKATNNSQRTSFFLQKLQPVEEKELQQYFLSKIRSGEISEKRGNIRDVEEFLPYPQETSDSSRTKFKRSSQANPNSSPDSQSLVYSTSRHRFDIEMNDQIKKDLVDNVSVGNVASFVDANVNSKVDVESTDESDAYSGVKPKPNRKNSGKRQVCSPEDDIFDQDSKGYIGENCKRKDRFKRPNSIVDDAEMTDVKQETSSLEVELSSSTEGQLFSPESVNSSHSSSKVNECDNENVSNEKMSSYSGSNQRDQDICQVETNEFVPQPLVRTRTFDLLESSCLSLNLETVSSDSHKSDEQKESIEDMKEMERKKGSLLFDNLQNYSTNVHCDGSKNDNYEHENLNPDSNLTDQIPHATFCVSNAVNGSLSDRSSLTLPIEEVQRKSSKRSESPSPDSLCTDLPSDTLNRAVSRSKEILSVEEKEKDDIESQPSSHTFNEIESKRKTTKNTSDSSIISWAAPHDTSFRSKEKTTPRTQRQLSNSSVKNSDEVPVLAGFDACQESDNQKMNQENKDASQKQNQSFFSMFIDINDLPSPEPPKPKLQHSGGTYMFIEAESTPSPKSKRKGKPPESLSKKLEQPVEESIVVTQNTQSNESEKKQSSKKSFFVYIDPNDASNDNTPNPSKKPPPSSKTISKSGSKSIMSKSAPGNCLLFGKDKEGSKHSSGEPTSSKLMTKSVIDRDEFIAQTSTRRNVSLSDRIGESSKIPRPISNFKELLMSDTYVKSTNSEIEDHINKSRISNSSKPVEGSSNNSASASSSVSDRSSNLPLEPKCTLDFSDVSSLLNSIGRRKPSSGESGENSLANDLLRMFENEIKTDVTIKVGEREIRGHRCILASRCVYFAAMLSGRWMELDEPVVSVEGFSADAVLVALKHIYSGRSSVPDGVRPEELAALADMWALDGLKEVVGLHFKAKLCHYFHKPCSECLSGVLTVLPIAYSCCMDELYYKGVKWIAKHFAVVLPSRKFASLSPDLRERCLKRITDDTSVNSAMDTALGCERILSSLPVARWTQPVFELTARILEATISFIAVNLPTVLDSGRFMELGCGGGWGLDHMEETLRSALEEVRPDQAVLAHITLSNLQQEAEEAPERFTENFVQMLENLLKQVEKFLTRNVNRVSVCRKWPLLSPDTQKRIKDAALILVEFSKPSPAPMVPPRSKSSRDEAPLRPRTSSLSDRRISRSATASSPFARPHAAPSSASRLKLSDRGHTPPPSAYRSSLQTPPPTRTSTLRAQARQFSVQRSQSAKAVQDRPPDVARLKGTDVPFASSAYPKAPVKSQLRLRTHSQSSSAEPPRTGGTPFGRGLAKGGHKRNASGPQLKHFTKAPSLGGSGETSKNLLLARSTEGLAYKDPGGHSQRENQHNETRDRCVPEERASSAGHAGRTPLKENSNIVPSPSRVPIKIGSGLSPSTKGRPPSSGKPNPGLGNRSNTFSREDRPLDSNHTTKN